MGVCGSSGSGDTPHVMLAGLENSGKTFFLYKYIKTGFIENTTKQRTTSTTVDIAHYKVAIWDIPGRESLRILWPNFYRTIEFSGVMFFIDYENKDKLPEACHVLHELLNEDELKSVSVIICFNKPKKSQEEGDKQSINNSIHDDMDAGVPLEKVNPKGEDDKEDKVIKEMEKAIYFDKIPQLNKEIYYFDFYNEGIQNSDLNELRLKLKGFVDKFYL